MKIGVSSKGEGLGAWIEPDFSKCGFLIIVDDNSRFTSIKNKGHLIDLINKAIEEGIQAFVTGSIDKHVLEQLRRKNVSVYLVQYGSILDLVEQINDGKLIPTDITF